MVDVGDKTAEDSQRTQEPASVEHKRVLEKS